MFAYNAHNILLPQPHTRTSHRVISIYRNLVPRSSFISTARLHGLCILYGIFTRCLINGSHNYALYEATKVVVKCTIDNRSHLVIQSAHFAYNLMSFHFECSKIADWYYIILVILWFGRYNSDFDEYNMSSLCVRRVSYRICALSVHDEFWVFTFYWYVYRIPHVCDFFVHTHTHTLCLQLFVYVRALRHTHSYTCNMYVWNRKEEFCMSTVRS